MKRIAIAQLTSETFAPFGELGAHRGLVPLAFAA